MLQADRISVAHRGGPTVLREQSVTVQPGQIVALTGPSGSEKSTLLGALAGLLPVAAGSITVDGQPVITRRGRMDAAIAIVAQDIRSAANPYLSIDKIVTEPARIARRPVVPATELLGRVGLSAELVDRRPRELSVGQLQRVCLARALQQRPRYLLCDEPTSALDPTSTQRVCEVLRELQADGVGLVISTHDHDLVADLADDHLSLRLSPT